MFTGIVQRQGTVVGLTGTGQERVLALRPRGEWSLPVRLGDSIAVNGGCLTVSRLDSEVLEFDVSNETLDRTNLGQLKAGNQVNLEASMSAESLFGGHLVAGHVDGLATLMNVKEVMRSRWMEFKVASSLASFLAEKGSLALDGVSLTVNQVRDEEDGVWVSVNVIPHTLAMTTLGQLVCGDSVNVEVDLVARYLERARQVEQTYAATNNHHTLIGNDTL
ncbi:MAG: riboflavin synthase [Arenicellales bacterium]|nr:riboflavin synthase [Arenicellales bacterium]